MDLMDQSKSLLLVSSSEKFNASVSPLFRQTAFSPVVTAGDVGSARRILCEKSFDAVVINSPLPDEFGTRLAMDLCSSSCGILLLLKVEHFPEVCQKTSPLGILTVSKPTSSALLVQALWLLRATRERLLKMERKTATMEEKMAEIRTVNRAKWVLIDQMKMTEQEAHRYIEKQAMDRCVTKQTVAEQILLTYRES